jgi:translation initiation factor RLI1
MFIFCCLPAYGHSKEPKIWNIPLQLEAFTGREKQLSDIKGALLKDYLVSIVGLAGIGKTIFVKEYATRNKQAYDVVWFVDLNRDLEGQLLELALELKHHGNPPEK